MIPLPEHPTPNERALQSWARESFTGLTTTAITLGNKAVSGMDLVFKNGVLLTPTTDYTVSGNTVTLASAAIAGDKFVVLYIARSGA